MEAHVTQGRKLVVLADGHLDSYYGKTAIGLIRYRPTDVVAVIEQASAGCTTQGLLGVGGDIPIVATLREALEHQPDALVIGVASRGGMIPPEWRPILIQAIDNGLDIISGLHDFVSEDRELRRKATKASVTLIDMRRPPYRVAVAEGLFHRAESTVITMVGSDCAVGKMSVALDVEASARTRGMDAVFLATGQTGMMIAGNGVPVDRVIGDFMSGAVEKIVLRAAAEHEIVLVEGQGSLLHPAYSGVTLALIHGSRPDAMILTVMAARHVIEDYDVPIPSIPRLIQLHEEAAGWVHPAPVIAVAVNSAGLSSDEARHVITSIESEAGLPATDTFRFGPDALVDAIEEFHERRTQLKGAKLRVGTNA